MNDSCPCQPPLSSPSRSYRLANAFLRRLLLARFRHRPERLPLTLHCKGRHLSWVVLTESMLTLSRSATCSITPSPIFGPHSAATTPFGGADSAPVSVLRLARHQGQASRAATREWCLTGQYCGPLGGRPLHLLLPQQPPRNLCFYRRF